MNSPDSPAPPRQTPAASSHVAALTGLRGLAAVFVFLFHYDNFNPGIRLDLLVPLIGPALQLPLGLGFAGVDLFFVLSGFLLTLPFASARLGASPVPDTWRYYGRRLRRVFPAYYAQLVILLLVGGWFVSWRPLSGWDWPAHLVMAFNLTPEGVRPMVGVWWTLPIELSFYLLLPMLARFMYPGRWTLLILVSSVVAIAWRLWAADSFPSPTQVVIASHLPGCLPEFLLGSAAAMCALRLRRRGGVRPLMADLLFGFAMLTAGLWLWWVVLPYGRIFWSGHWSMLIQPLVMGTLLALAVGAAWSGSRIARWLFANRVVHGLGVVSYSLYLWHFVVMQQLEKFAGAQLAELHGLLKFLLVCAVVVAVSVVSYFCFERPFYRGRQ